MIVNQPPPQLAQKSAERWTYDRYLRETAEGEYFSVNWIVSPIEYTIEVLSLKEGQYESIGLYEDEETITSPLLAGFTVKISTLFEE